MCDILCFCIQALDDGEEQATDSIKEKLEKASNELGSAMKKVDKLYKTALFKAEEKADSRLNTAVEALGELLFQCELVIMRLNFSMLGCNIMCTIQMPSRAPSRLDCA